MEWGEYFEYLPDTGQLVWKIDRIHPRTKERKGDVAGRPQKRGYLNLWIGGKLFLAHRVIWEMNNGKIPEGLVIDHKDHNTANNRLDNLRLTSQTLNVRNNALSSANSSGVTGVMWRKKEGCWLASITVNRKRIYLGRYEDKDQAIAARKLAEKEYGFYKNHGNKRRITNGV